MADRTSAEIFGYIFQEMAKSEPSEITLGLAREIIGADGEEVEEVVYANKKGILE